MPANNKAAAKAPHIPAEGGKCHALLRVLLNGERVDPFYALMELNLPSVGARVSELRRMGWPIRAVTLPHPKLPEHIVAYVLDAHFRRWLEANPCSHPSTYASQDGRGKFAEWTPAQFLAGGVTGEAGAHE